MQQQKPAYDYGAGVEVAQGVPIDQQNPEFQHAQTFEAVSERQNTGNRGGIDYSDPTQAPPV